MCIFNIRIMFQLLVAVAQAIARSVVCFAHALYDRDLQRLTALPAALRPAAAGPQGPPHSLRLR